MSWPDLSEWWLGEIKNDATYDSVVTSLLLEILAPVAGATYLDLGSGEGRVMRSVAATGAVVQGLDINEKLVRQSDAMAVVADLPDIPARRDSYDGTYAVLVLEHLADHESLFSEAFRVVKTGGILALVANHPVWTTSGSTPIEDTDGEVHWRPGDYFSEGSTEISAAGGSVTFYHWSMAVLLTSAAQQGWSLERLIEQPHHELTELSGTPRLLACRWRG